MISVSKDTLKGKALNELQGQAVNILAGAAAGTRFNLYRGGTVSKGLRSYDTLLVGIKHPAAAIPTALTLTNASKEFLDPSKFSITTKNILNIQSTGHGLLVDDYVELEVTCVAAERASTVTDADTFTAPFVCSATAASIKKGVDGTQVPAPRTVTSQTDGVITVDGVTNNLTTGDKVVFSVVKETMRLKVTAVPDANNFRVEIPNTFKPQRVTYSGVVVTEDTAACAAEIRWFSRDNL